jgi:hypothetical protein
VTDPLDLTADSAGAGLSGASMKLAINLPLIVY